TPVIIVAVQGQVMPLMQGPAGEEQLRQGLGQVFAALAEQGMLPEGHPGTVEGEPGDQPEEAATAQQADERAVDVEAQEALDCGDFEAAAAAYEKALEAHP